MKRRKFIKHLGAGTLAGLAPYTAFPFTPAANVLHTPRLLRFGIVADVHKDLMPDADERLEKFIQEAQNRAVDFIIQLGDFCMAEAGNRDFLRIWRSFRGPRYHVLGNHDMDRHTKAQMLDYWEMPATYYSFDQGGYHFIVLDANFLYQDGQFTDYDKANFYVDSHLRTFINQEQIEWFEADLDATELPTIVFSHQSLWHYQWGVKNRLTLQKIMEDRTEKIICCLNGHNHIDFHRRQNGIDYIEINSMSYQWMGDKYRSTERFPAALYEQYEWLPNLAAYRDPLFAFATIHPKGQMTIEGVKSEWISPSPFDLGMPPGMLGSVYSAEISNYDIRFGQ